MTSNSSLLRRMLRLIVWECLPLTAFGQNAPRIAPVPRDPLELATCQIEAANTPASREAALQLLARARSHFALRSARQAYDLKVSFTVDSHGETNYDGAWQMEDLFAPRLGHRWTATAASGYTITAIAATGEIYAEGTANTVPLRLLEARGVLFDPLQSPDYAGHGSIRTSTTVFDGATVTCLLLSRSRNPANPAPDGIGKKPRSVSTGNRGCSGCIRRRPESTPFTITRTPFNWAVTLCLEALP